MEVPRRPLLRDLLLVLIPIAVAASTHAAPAPRIGSQAPAFTLENIPGQKLTLARLRGWPVVLVVGMTQKSAPPCREWMRALVAHHAKKAHLLQVVVVDRSWYIPKWLIRKKIKKFVGKTHQDKVLIEWGLAFARRYGIAKDDTPTVLLIDKSGFVSWRFHGKLGKGPWAELSARIGRRPPSPKQP